MLRLTRTVRGCLAWALVAFVAMLCAPPAGAEGILVSTELSAPLNPNGTVRQWDVSPDGRYAVWIADPVGREEAELYSRRLDGGEYVTLVRIFMHDESVRSFRISPDSQYVVLTIGKFEDPQWRVVRLLSVPIGGGDPVLLNIPAHTAPHDLLVRHLPDSTRGIRHGSAHRRRREAIQRADRGGPSGYWSGSTRCARPASSPEFTPNGERVVRAHRIALVDDLAMVPALRIRDRPERGRRLVRPVVARRGRRHCRHGAETFGLFAVLSTIRPPLGPFAALEQRLAFESRPIAPGSTLTDETTRTATSVPTLPQGSVTSRPLAAAPVDRSSSPDGLGVVHRAPVRHRPRCTACPSPAAIGAAESLAGRRASLLVPVLSTVRVVYLASAGTPPAPVVRSTVHGGQPGAPERPPGLREACRPLHQRTAPSCTGSPGARWRPGGVRQRWHVLRIGPCPYLARTMLNPYDGSLRSPRQPGRGLPGRSDGQGHWRPLPGGFTHYTPMVLR